VSAEARIRLATADDVDELARLRWQLYAEDGPEMTGSFEEYRTRFLRFAREALAGDDWRAWVAMDGDRLVGFSLAMVWPSDRSFPFYERAGFARPPDPLILDLGGDWHHRGPAEAGGRELA
jgi:Acetyltransferase (GNAT) domain